MHIISSTYKTLPLLLYSANNDDNVDNRDNYNSSTGYRSDHNKVLSVSYVCARDGGDIHVFAQEGISFLISCECVYAGTHI